jgi:hypothetical protein
MTDMPSDGDRAVMNDIDDDRDELAFAKLDLARYLTMPCSSHRRRAGHWVQQEQPQQASYLLLQFVKQAGERENR